MEGKAQLFQRFVGLNGVPIVLDTTNVDEMFDTICRIAPSFGAINLRIFPRLGALSWRSG